MNAQGVTPARHEVERQLDRMLAHPLFQARPRQSTVFEFLVRSALNGKEVNEMVLFLEFFKDKMREDEDTTHVRTTVSYIRRDLLEKYYAEDGSDDPVIIALPAPERIPQPGGKYKIVKRPPGEAYTPEFSYNPRSEIAQAFAIADHLMRGGRLQVERSLWLLDAIDKAAPGHPDVALALAEAVGCHVIADIFGEAWRPHLVAGALAWLDRLDPGQADAWGMQNVRGLLHFCDGDMQKAGEAFARALALDRQATINRGWYIHFLFAADQEEEALRLLGLLAGERVSNAQTQAIHGLYLNKAKRYEESARAFALALALDRNCWPAHYGFAQSYLATGKQDKAVEHLKRLETLVEPQEYEEMKRKLEKA